MKSNAEQFFKFQKRLFQKMKAVERAGVQPTRMYLTKEDELALSCVPASHAGDKIVANIVTNGCRKAVPKLYGLKITWGAKYLKVA